MEDNNNDEITTSEKESMKKEEKKDKKFKKVFKKTLRKILPAILPAISLFLLILLIVGLINAIVVIIQSIFAAFFNFFNPSKPDSTLATSGSTSAAESVIYIDDNGAYKLKVEDIADQILAQLEEKKVNTEILGLREEMIESAGGESADSETFDEDMIEKYIKAEIQTTYPKTGCLENDVDGTIIIKRATKDGDIKPLTYTNYKNFCNNVSSGNSEVLSQFSLNPDTFDLCIARKAGSTEYIGANGEVLRTEASENSEAGYVKEEINYQKYVQNYSAPLNFFITLHLISQDVDFMQDLYEMVIGKGKDEPIVLTYVDSYYQSTTEYQYSGNDKTNFRETSINEHAANILVPDRISEEDFQRLRNNTPPSKEINNSNVEDYIGSVEYYKKNVTSYAGILYVSNADTWLNTSGKDIIITEAPSPDTSNPTPNPIKDYDKSEKYYIVDNIDADTLEITTTYWRESGHVKINQIETTINTGTSVTVVDKESKINVDKFVELIKSYPGVENNFKTSPSNIFLMLQQTENTQRLEKIMRYVMFVLDDVDYGVREADLEYLLADSQFTYVSSFEKFKQYSRYWENPQIAADEEHYIITKDENGNLTAGYGVNLEENRTILEEAGYILEEGKEIDKDVIDGIEEAKIIEITADVRDITKESNLTTYQINALVSRSYDKGAYDTLEEQRGSPAMNFVDSYENYWKQEDDDMFKEEATNDIFEHELYTQYMSATAVTSNSENENLDTKTQQRRMSEWILFRTGYYREINQWQSSGDDILDVADQIHYYMEKHGYTYCVFYTNEYEECGKYGKKCGLNSSFEASMSGHQNTCCATFVSWVLQEAGYITEKDHDREGLNSAKAIRNFLKNNGWTVISSVSDLQPGDVLCYNGHVEIYAGDGTVYNAGSGNAIRGESPSKKDGISSIICGLRAPNK